MTTITFHISDQIPFRGLLWILLLLQSLNTLGSQDTVRRAIFQDIWASWRPFPHTSSVFKNWFPKQAKQGAGKLRQLLSNISHCRCADAIESPAAERELAWLGVIAFCGYLPNSKDHCSSSPLIPFLSMLAVGKGLSSPSYPHSFSHLFPVLRIFCALISHTWQSELTPCPSRNKLLFSGNTEEHPFTPFLCSSLLFMFSLLLWAQAWPPLLGSLTSQSPFLYLSPSQVFWAAFKKCGCNWRSKMK